MHASLCLMLLYHMQHAHALYAIVRPDKVHDESAAKRSQDDDAMLGQPSASKVVTAAHAYISCASESHIFLNTF